MNAMKGIVMIVLVLSLFTLFILPMETGVFPSWIETELIQLLLMLLTVICALVLIR